MDRWDRKTDFGCNSCMFFVPKMIGLPGKNVNVVFVETHDGRCRRSAPTMKGYPVVFADDWCGEHKRGSNPVRDASPAEEELQIGDQSMEMASTTDSPTIVTNDRASDG